MLCIRRYRPRKFPWGYNEAGTRCVALKETLAKEIAKLVDAGYTDFLSGMAEGTDAWAAIAVLALKRENPALRLHCVLPCEGQADGWPVSARGLYFSILEQADEVVYVSREYREGCMLERNCYLVDHAACLLAVYNGDDGEVCQEAGTENHNSFSNSKMCNMRTICAF